MGNTTPNISIYIPANGESIYGAAFKAGMENIDEHDHSGAPNKGLPLAGSGIADFAVTYQKLNANVVDTTTGVGVSAATPNKIEMLGILKNIYQQATVGILAKDGSTANARTITGTTDQIDVANGNGSGGNPTISLAANVINTQQTSFNYGIASNQNNVTGDGTTYLVQFPSTAFYGEGQQGTTFNSATGIWTCPKTGYYLFGVSLQLDDLNTGGPNSTELSLYVNATHQYKLFYIDTDGITAGGRAVISGSQMIKVTAGDTVDANLRVNDGGGVKYVDISDGNFWGVLLC